MAKPRIFISSTYYDLKHLRSSLENFIEQIGFEPVLSEKGDIAYVPDAPLDESCYREVRNADIYVLIMGGRYGSEASHGKTKLPKDFFDRYESITKLEYKAAVDTDIPVYILIEKSVYADYENFLKNKDTKDFKYAHVDSANIFFLVEEILAQARNNPVFQFDKYSEIEIWLKEQWAGLFRELLKRMSSQQQLSSLSAQVGELAEINQTLKRYLEALVSKVVPTTSQHLIKTETERLNEARRLSMLEQNALVRFLTGPIGLPIGAVHSKLAEESDFESFLDSMGKIAQNESAGRRLTLLKEVAGDRPRRDFQDARRVLDLSVREGTSLSEGRKARKKRLRNTKS